MALIIFDSEDGSVIRIEVTIDELRKRTDEWAKKNVSESIDILNDDDEWGEWHYESGWTIFDESDITNATLDDLYDLEDK